jgi:Na+/phosphate symporter
VDAGALTFRASLGVLLGANVGTTATAWLARAADPWTGTLFGLSSRPSSSRAV